jgi:hypothetical protein
MPRIVLVSLFCSSLVALGCAAPPGGPDPVGEAAQAETGSGGPFDVAFAGCREVANVGLLPTANARPLVPAQYALVGDGSPVTPFVVRSVHCDSISVGEGSDAPGNLIQIGFLIVGPDGDGDINNYTVYYDTSHARLAERLRMVGVPARNVPLLSESVSVNSDGSGIYDFVVPAPFDPTLEFSGPVGAPVGGPIPFVANWWATASGVTVKMNSSFPQLFIADDDVTLTVPAGSPLANLLGTTTVSSWPVLKLYDNFPSAQMHVTLR